MLEQPIYELADINEIRAMVSAYPWAVIASSLPSGPVISHLPVLIDTNESGGLVILGHLASQDAAEHQLGKYPVAVVVQGPHGYISPTFYVGGPYVPTWNFVVIHFHGVPHILPADETFEVLDRTVSHLERVRPQPFKLSEVAEYAAAIAPHTTGFRLRPRRTVAKAKLSQDKPVIDRRGVVHGLEEDPCHANPALAAAMRRLVEQ